MTALFQFEADFADSLRCIPMVVRFKLDTCGVKLKLSDWNQFSTAERQQLVDWPCMTVAEMQTYRDRLHALVLQYSDTTPSDLPIDLQPEWMLGDRIPDSVASKAAEMNIGLTLAQWASLSPIQRFALIKLSRSNHENRNFVPAVQEFLGNQSVVG